ncbi:MinD/ParA family protein [Caldibacillus lycopersici]|uniref:MinD/ParA family protein n=1 Tax=Perspicuibacillus lycopersici TaxID=1325689 RepID=A0AAE3LL89_9BACI|nr:MinD/ParA family protein [Perspicuibacillus lycopersici]MCU9612085.1 MinD/ParA family protein [Perspicuibacillus lycopersici]
MNDQAEKLRYRIKRQLNGKNAKTIAFISGKGGVGKSNVSLNFSIALAQQGKRVLIFDLDIGMGNIDLLAGITPNKTIAHYFMEDCPLDRIIEEGPEGIHFIAGGSGLDQFVKLDKSRIEYLIKELHWLLYEYDYLVFDIGAGMDEGLVQFLAFVEHIFVVVTPEPTSIMDAYSAIKYLYLQSPNINIHLMGNRMKNDRENMETFERLLQAMDHFLQKDAEVIGFIPEDSQVVHAVKMQIPFIIFKPNAQASKKMKWLAYQFLLNYEDDERAKKEPNQFIDKLRSILIGR